LSVDRARAAAMGGAAAAAVLVLALLADGYARHGVTATWRTLQDDEIRVVDRTIEHRTTFENMHRPVSRYVQGWHFDEWGVPDHLPAIDAVLEGTLDVPEGPPRRIHAETPNAAEVRVDGRPTEQGPVDPGTHELTVYWHGPLQEEGAPHWWQETLPAGLELTWGDEERGFEPVPRTALTPSTGAWTPLRIALWIVGPLAALLLGLGVFAIARADGGRRSRRVAVVVTACIVAVGLGYRAWDYDVVPELRENQDELFATWNGWQLLEDGTTRGWSLWPAAYGGMVRHERLEYFRDHPIPVIRPYLEHPPLLHLLAGAAARIGGASDWSHARLEDTRIVPIALNVLVLVLLVAVGRRLDPGGPAPYLAGLLYAVLPIIAIQARAVKEEALLVPLLLGSLLFYLRWRDDGERRRDLVGAAVLAGLCTLTKVPGLVFVPVLVMLLTARRRYREAIVAGAVGLGVSSLLLLYAAWVDWDLFWYTTGIQAGGRPSHWNLYPRFFDDPLINHNLVGRGWLLFLWIAWAATAFRRDRRGVELLVLPPIVYMTGMAISSGTWTFGWYLMPIHPFLCLGAGRFLTDLWKSTDLVRSTLFVGLVIMYAMNFTIDEEWVRRSSSWPVVRHWINLLAAGFLVPFALSHAFRTRPLAWLARASFVAALALMVGLSGWFVVRYDVLSEQYRDFDRNVYFDR